MADRIRAHDWASTPLGPISGWPPSLKTAVGLVVAAPVPIVMLWGPEGVMIYNDAYSVFAGGRHPRLLGANVREGWPEVADFNDHVMKVGLAGGTLAYRDQELTLHRHGEPEQVWMDLDYWPAPGEDGRPAGVIATVIETSSRVRADRARSELERRQAALIELDEALADISSLEDIGHAASRILGETLGASRVGYGVIDPEAQTIRIARDWTAPGQPSVAGDHQFGEYGSYVEELMRGEPAIIADVGQDPRTAPNPGPLLAYNIRALMDVPTTEGGRTVAQMLVHSDRPRVWSEGEVAFARTFAERTRTAAARREAESRLRESERRYRTLFETMDEGFCVIEFVDGPAGPLSDYVHVEANAAAAKQVGLAGVVGRSIREIADQEAPEWIDLYRGVLETGRPIRLEKSFEATGRWLEVAAFPVEPAGRRQVAVLFKDLTEKRQAETAVRESEARFRNMADNTPMMMWVTDPDGYCTYLNRTWYEFTGQTVGEAEGFGWLDATHPDDRPRTEQVFLAANAAREPFRTEYRLRRSDGVYRWALDAAMPRFGAHGEYLGYVGSVIDIDERREAEDALRASEAQFRAFSEAVPNHVWASRPDGHLYWFNSQVYAYAGVEEGALDGAEGWGRIVHPDDLPGAAESWGRALATGASYRTEFRILRGDGEWRWFAVHAEPVRDADGAILRWVGANIDIEDIRRQGEELDQVNETLSALLAGSKAERDQLWTLSEDMLARADYEGGLSAVNPAWTKVLGWSEHELLTNPYADIIHPDDVPTTVAALEMMGETRKPTRFENLILSKSGAWTPIGWTVSPEPDGLNFIAVGRDLTADKAREAQLARAEEALRQSQKMEAVGQLTGGIAHDFNNLLAGISGSLELLEKRMAEGRLAGVERYISAAQGASRRAAALTQRLLAFSRRQTLDPKPTDVNRLIAGMEDLIRRSVGPDIEVEVVGAGGLWTTRIDPSQLENALLNLCINSRDAMAPDGGRLTIETANKWLDDRAARERDVPPGQYISLCVTDTGCGMPPEIQSQAFDPFFTTKPLGQGTGLGLSMIHGFVRQSGGAVRIYSEVGKGTTLCLYLPRHTGEAESSEAAPFAIVADGGHGETVLVIDDEPTVRMLVVEVLEEAGYVAMEAPDGPSGLAILRSDVRIDLLITDVGLPGGMNGRQVADAARETRPDLKVLFVTGYAENAAVGDGHLDPGMEVMTKPFAMAVLGAKIREMIEG